MSSNAEGVGGGCRKCGAAIDGKPWLFVLGTTLLTLGFLPINPGALCARCRDSYDFLGLLMLSAAVVVGFVLVVMWLG
jgi:uncharacterized membrane-anchored protein